MPDHKRPNDRPDINTAIAGCGRSGNSGAAKNRRPNIIVRINGIGVEFKRFVIYSVL
jgi:hypothetical protein